MKKRIVSLLLALCLLAGLLPAVTPQADAVISTVIGTSLKMCTSLVKGGIYACRNGSEYDNAGQGVLAVFKYAGSDLLGIDFGGSSSGQTKETVIQKVDLSKVEAELSSISKQLEKNSAAIHQLERTVSNGIASLSQQMENLSGQIQNATLELKYSTYLNTFFEFFNQYYEALSYYDRLVTDMLDESASPAYQKNIYDQFYSLQNVEYSGNLHSAVDKLGRYLQGKYIYSGPGSVVDVLTQYYILAYQGGGKTEQEARAAAAQSTQDMIVYLYYAYVMGAYYEQAIALYQTAYITENGSLYQTDFGTMISQKQIDATVTALWSDVEQTAGCILGDLRSNYHQDVAFEVVYQTPGGRMLNRTISGDSFVIETGANFWLRDPAEELAKYFDESLSEAFSGIAKFTIRAQSAADPTYLQIHDNAFFHVKTTEEGGFEYGRRFLKLDVEFGGKTMQTITLVLYKQIDSGPFAGGLGTEDYPYIIKTADQLAAISPQDTSKPSYADCQFILHADLNMEGKSFTGMRNFSGTFDGNGHEIFNVVLTGMGGDTAHTVGLFGELTGTVRNLIVRNATVTGLTADGDSGGRSGDLCVGVLAGLVNGGKIEYCAVYDSSVTGEHSGAGVVYAGGAVGKLAGKETGEAGEAALRGVVCVDTSVRAVTTKAANPQEFLPWADGSAIAGGLVGYYLTGTINECGYIQSEKFQGSISAKGATGAAAGGLTGYERAPFSNLMWLALGAAPKVEKQNASAEDRYYQVGLLTGNGYAANAVYHLWGSRASERGSTPLNGDPWWQLQWSTKAVDKITTKVLQDHVDGVNWKEKPDFDLEAYTEREDGAGLYPEFDLGTSGSEYQAVLLTDGPIRKNYVEGDYLTLSGLNVWQDVGFHVEEGAKYPYFEITEGANLINKPLPAGEYQFAVRASNGYRVTYKITVKPTEHIYISATTEPTCTEPGFTNLTCLHCGLTKRAGELEALGHDVVTDAAVPPTCVSDGLTEGSHCARCGEVFTAQTTVPSTGEHAHVVTPGKAATCTEPGLSESEACPGCGLVFREATVLPALGHDMVDHTILAPTCTTDGMQQSVCSRCELIGPLKSVPATGHDMQTRTVLAPTCTAAGMEQEVCTHCGETGALTNLPALGHDYAAVVTEPTCETPGFTTHTCGRCGDHFTDSYIAPTGHTYGDGVVTREPTCTREGEMTYTCSCGKTHTEPIAKLAHSYVPQIVEPTCTELGYTAYVCAHCGDRTTGDYVRELGHDWNAGTVVQAPRLTKEGLLEQTCRRCGAEQKTVLPVLESCAGTICPSHDYHDAPEFGHWSHAGIDYTLELGLFRGTSDTEFSPNVAMTRAMLVTVLYRLDGQKEPTGANPFTDVEPDSWYTEAVIWAVENEIVLGMGDGTFAPEAEITREQMAAILYRYAAYRGDDMTTDADLAAFPDEERVSAYAREALAWAVDRGLINGVAQGGESWLEPQAGATRAQVATILMRFLKQK